MSLPAAQPRTKQSVSLAFTLLQSKRKVVDLKEKLPSKTIREAQQTLSFLSPQLQKTLNAIMIDDGTNISIQQSLMATPVSHFNADSPSVIRAKDRFIQKARERMTKEKKAPKASMSIETKVGQPKIFELTKEILRQTEESKKKEKPKKKEPVQPRTPKRTKQIVEEYKRAENTFDSKGQPASSPQKLEAQEKDTFAYVKIENMEALRHKPGPEPREFEQAKKVVRENRDERHFRAKHGHKYAEPKVTTWKGQHAGVVSEITKEGINIAQDQDPSRSMTQQLNPKALTALGAMNTLFGRKGSLKKKQSPQKKDGTQMLNISAAETLTPSWAEEGTTAIGSPILRQAQNSSMISNSFMSTAVKNLADMRSRSVTSLKRKDLASSTKKPTPYSGKKSINKSESIGDLAKSLDMNAIPGCVVKVISASKKKYPKLESKKLMTLFNKILALLDPKFDQEDVYKTIRILKQLCEQRYVPEEELDDIEREFSRIKEPPEADKKHFQIYEFVNCVVTHFREKFNEQSSQEDEFATSEDQERPDEVGGQALGQADELEESTFGGYMSDFTPRNEDYESDPFLAQVAPPSNHIQATLAKKYKIPTLALPSYHSQVGEESKEIPLKKKMMIKSPSAKARIGVHDQISPSAAIVVSPTKASSPQKYQKRRELNKAISLVMNENIKSLKKFFTRIDKLTRESMVRDQSRSYSVANHSYLNNSKAAIQTPAKTVTHYKSKSGTKKNQTTGKKKRRFNSTTYNQTAFFSPDQTSHFAIRHDAGADPNTSAAATIVRQLARLSESKKSKRDPYEGPDALNKNEVYLYPFSNSGAYQKHLVVKVKERNASPTKRLINLKNAREETSKHLGRLGSQHKYNVCVMSKDRDEYHNFIQSRKTAQPRMSQSLIQGDSGDSDLERAPKAESVNYEADQEMPPEPQNPPAATKMEPQKQLQHESFSIQGFSPTSPIQLNSMNQSLNTDQIIQFQQFSPALAKEQNDKGPASQGVATAYVSFGDDEKKQGKKGKKIEKKTFKSQTLPRNHRQLPATQVKIARKVVGDSKKNKNFLSDAIKRDRDRLERSSRILLTKKPSSSALLLNTSAQ